MELIVFGERAYVGIQVIPQDLQSSYPTVLSLGFPA